MKVRFSERASADLDDIADWLMAETGERALSFMQSLRRSCAGLGDMPLRFPIVSTHPSMTIRRRVHGNYLIFYVVEDQAVCILRIIHGARDYESLLFPQD